MLVSDKFGELQQLGQSPVCLFLTRKSCDDFNAKMLKHLTSEVHDFMCTDEVDETAGTHKLSKKAAESLENLKKTVT